MIYRNNETDKTILLVHGLAGDTVWQPFVNQILAYPPLDEWDIHSFEYGVHWYPHLSRFGFSLSPSLSKVANYFRTYCQSRLSRYKSISILAHSAGGLVVQRAIIDSEWLRSRTRNICLFATPSGGVPGKRIFGLVHPQVRDILIGSQFLRELEPGQRLFTHMKSFSMRVVSSLDDKIVPSRYVFEGFPYSMQRTVPGNHVSLIQPSDFNAEVFRVLADLLLKPRIFLSYVHEDELEVLNVYRTLEKNDLAPWIDRRNIDPGSPWEESIKEALNESDRFLVFLSRKALAKLSDEKSVFRNEVLTSIEIEDKRHTPFLIPIRLDNSELPEIVDKYQSFDLFSSDAEKLTEFLEYSIGSLI